MAQPLPSTGNPFRTYLETLSSPRSRRSQGSALSRIASMLGSQSGPGGYPWHRLRYEDVVTVRSRLETEYAHTTANRYLSALRGVLRTCWRMGLMSSEQYAQASDIPNVKGHREPPGRALEPDEIQSLVSAAGLARGPAGHRDRALIAVLVAGGLRRAEVIQLLVSDLALGQDHGCIRVKGKGNKERAVYLSTGAYQALVQWLDVRGDEPGPLFCRLTKSGSVLPTKSMSATNLTRILNRVAKRAGVESVTPHDMRRTMASHMLDAGADIVVVQRRMGHASPTTTARYDRRDERAQVAAAALAPFHP